MMTFGDLKLGSIFRLAGVRRGMRNRILVKVSQSSAQQVDDECRFELQRDQKIVTKKLTDKCCDWAG
jgi:hypothetical protein